MAKEKERMEKIRLENATVGEATRELLGMVGMLHDFIDMYCDWHVRTYPALTNNGVIESGFYEKICEAMHPAISLLKDEVIERVRDFMDFYDYRAI